MTYSVAATVRDHLSLAQHIKIQHGTSVDFIFHDRSVSCVDINKIALSKKSGGEESWAEGIAERLSANMITIERVHKNEMALWFDDGSMLNWNRRQN